MAVVPFPTARTVTADVQGLLRTTLTFEAVVDALIGFHVSIGRLPSADVSPLERDHYRDAVTRMVNELDVVARVTAEQRTHEYILDRGFQQQGVLMFVHDACEVYRTTLQQTPVRGVGVLR